VEFAACHAHCNERCMGGPLRVTPQGQAATLHEWMACRLLQATASSKWAHHMCNITTGGGAVTWVASSSGTPMEYSAQLRPFQSIALYTLRQGSWRQVQRAMREGMGVAGEAHRSV
jgi:hypothetical protein